MKIGECKHEDCFTCPYPDCIIGMGARKAKAKRQPTPEEIEKRKEHRREWERNYYRLHPERRKQRARERYARMKAQAAAGGMVGNEGTA